MKVWTSTNLENSVWKKDSVMWMWTLCFLANQPWPVRVLHFPHVTNLGTKGRGSLGVNFPRRNLAGGGSHHHLNTRTGLPFLNWPVREKGKKKNMTGWIFRNQSMEERIILSLKRCCKLTTRKKFRKCFYIWIVVTVSISIGTVGSASLNGTETQEN